MASREGATRLFVSSLSRALPRLILVVLFGFSSIDKVAHFSRFVRALQSYHVLPTGTELYAALFIIMAELAIAIGLATGRWRRPACMSAVLLLGTFTVVYLVVAPEDVCGCWFTLTLTKGGYIHILQNLVFIGLAVLTWLDSQSSTTRTEGGQVSLELPLS